MEGDVDVAAVDDAHAAALAPAGGVPVGGEPAARGQRRQRQGGEEVDMHVDEEGAGGAEAAAGPAWAISAPTSRSMAMCATCLGEVPARTPRVRRGGPGARVRHIGCVAHLCGPVDRLAGWSALRMEKQLEA